MLIGTYNATYIGKTMCGFETAHSYLIKIGKDLYGYQISGIYDLTDNDNSSAYLVYASEKSIRRNWNIIKDMTELG